MDSTRRPILRPAALGDGFSDGEIKRMIRNKEWHPLRRGGYYPTKSLKELTNEERHELLVHASLAGLKKPAVVSHCSAAVLLGIPLWSVSLDVAHLTRQSPSHQSQSKFLRVHATAMESDEITEIGGVPVTCAARTIVDLAKTESYESAVAAADAALNKNLLTEGDLIEAATRSIGTPGSRGALRVARFADGRSESPGESVSRVLMKSVGLEMPELQFSVYDAFGYLLGRTDFSWRGGRVLGEFDGKVKYGDPYRKGESPADVLWREKRREDSLRANGALVVRWVWADLAPPRPFIVRIQRALAAVNT